MRPATDEVEPGSADAPVGLAGSGPRDTALEALTESRVAPLLTPDGGETHWQAVEPESAYAPTAWRLSIDTQEPPPCLKRAQRGSSHTPAPSAPFAAELATTCQAELQALDLVAVADDIRGELCPDHACIPPVTRFLTLKSHTQPSSAWNRQNPPWEQHV
jgi:hypothetical protein